MRQKLSSEETLMFPKKIRNHGIVYRDKFQKIGKIVAEFGKFKKIFYVTDYGPKSAIIVNKGNKILLTRQYRFLLNELSYEIPGGKINKNENPKNAAIRECVEETGLICKKLKLLIEYDPDLEYTKNHTYIFKSSNFKISKEVNRNKFIWISLERCLKLIKQGKIKDSLTIIAILSKYEKF